MIFSNKIYKISSGQNPALYAENENLTTLTIFKDLTEVKHIDFSSGVKCLNVPKTFGYNKVIKLNDVHDLICLDQCVSIVDNSV